MMRGRVKKKRGEGHREAGHQVARTYTGKQSATRFELAIHATIAHDPRKPEASSAMDQMAAAWYRAVSTRQSTVLCPQV